MILLVNDDGIDAPGLRALYHALRKKTKRPVLAVAPSTERSGQSHAITIDRGLVVTPRSEDGFSRTRQRRIARRSMPRHDRSGSCRWIETDD